MPATKIVVNIPGVKPYDVRLGETVLEDLGASLRKIDVLTDATKLLILSDSNVAPLYLDQTRASLEAARYQVSDIVVTAGEEAKAVEVAAEIWSALAQVGLGRDSAIVALGGGVVGDLAGFVASTYMRGIPFVQVPTTLLAMVDSSVGGKTGVNLPEGKNMVGTFKQPAFVCAATPTLTTLNDREWACGCAEIAKSSVIDSDEFFFWLTDHAEPLRERDMAVVTEAISRSVIFKAGVVAQDELESKGVRECLNYGHTLGHAIEALAGYGTYSHGAAVAEGMRFAARLGAIMLGTSEEFIEAQDELLDALNLPVLNWNAPSTLVLQAMKHDKKTRGGEVRFVLPRDIGQWEVVAVPDSVLLQCLEERGTRFE
jgi:3-dehydroquinate synthase